MQEEERLHLTSIHQNDGVTYTDTISPHQYRQTGKGAHYVLGRKKRSLGYGGRWA